MWEEIEWKSRDEATEELWLRREMRNAETQKIISLAFCINFARWDFSAALKLPLFFQSFSKFSPDGLQNRTRKITGKTAFNCSKQSLPYMVKTRLKAASCVFVLPSVIGVLVCERTSVTGGANDCVKKKLQPVNYLRTQWKLHQYTGTVLYFIIHTHTGKRQITYVLAEMNHFWMNKIQQLNRQVNSQIVWDNPIGE